MAGPCGCGGAGSGVCSCAVVGEDLVTVTGNGTPATPYTVSVTCDDVEACMADRGICVSEDPGNAITAGSDGCLYVSTSGLILGCGLRDDGAGGVEVATEDAANFPGGCAPEADGDPVFCGADGQLYVRPVPEATQASAALTSIPNQAVNNGDVVDGAQTNLSYTNNSCVPEEVTVMWRAATFDLSAGGASTVINGRFQTDAAVNGVPVPTSDPSLQAQVSNQIAGTPDGFNVGFPSRIYEIETFVLQPGDTLNAAGFSRIVCDSGSGGAAALGGSINFAIRGLS